VRVCILTEGGKDIGFGHITRCTAIYQVLQEREIQPTFIINDDESARQQCKGSDISSINFDWLNDTEKLFSYIEDADVVFVDSYLADYNLYENISKTAKTAVYFDDEMRINYPEGFVVNGAIFAEKKPYPERNGVTYLLGAQYAPLRKEFWDVPAKSIRDSIESVMITFGGADIRTLTPKILKLLVDTYPGLVKKVIIGKGFRNTSEIEAIKEHNTELIYYPDAAEMKKVMLESDIAISAGGQTLYELARVGIPTIAVTVADNQVDEAEAMQKVGFAEYAGDGTNGELTEKINRKIELLRDSNARQCKSIAGKKIIDGAGISRIVRSVLSDFHKGRLILRKATSADAEDLFNLANEDTVRRNSFSQSKREWVEHIRWLSEKLGDDNCLLLIIDCSDKFAGQVRFDVIPLQSEAVINISLCRGVRGLGLSAFVINKSIEELLKVRRDLKLIKAYVKDGNIASAKAFERAGFMFLEDTIFKGCKTKIYKRSVDNR
jgi:UDP-2,4-diacetamido-2,4,6-trideoxy-beta-L-altropyranose hydrolase